MGLGSKAINAAPTQFKPPVWNRSNTTTYTHPQEQGQHSSTLKFSHGNNSPWCYKSSRKSNWHINTCLVSVMSKCQSINFSLTHINLAFSTSFSEFCVQLLFVIISLKKNNEVTNKIFPASCYSLNQHGCCAHLVSLGPQCGPKYLTFYKSFINLIIIARLCSPLMDH